MIRSGIDLSQALYSSVYRGRGRQQLDDRAERALLGEEVALVDHALPEAARIVALDDLLDPGHVLAVVADDERGIGDRVEDGLGDLGLAAAGDRAGLVAQKAVGGRAHEAPGARAGVALHADAIARRVHVDLVRQDAQAPLPARAGPASGLVLEGDDRVLGEVDHLREGQVDGVALFLVLDPPPISARTPSRLWPRARRFVSGTKSVPRL